MNQDNACSKLKKAIILDTSALIAKYYRLLPRNIFEVYTTENAVREVIDRENREALFEAIDLGLITVSNPGLQYVEEARKKAIEVGSIHKLSKTDIEVAALAIQLNNMGYTTIVITDDYELQNLLLYIGIGFKPLRTRGVNTLRVYRAYCPVCGYTPASPGVETCPLCGAKITRRQF